MNTAFSHDAFLCHSAQDRSIIRNLAVRLRADGVNVWFDGWQIKPGDSIPRKLDQGIQSSRVMLFFCSSNSNESEWATLELFSVLMKSPANRNRRLVPVKLDDSNLPEIISQFAWVDWRVPSELEYGRLLEACTHYPPMESDDTSLAA